MSPWDPLAFSQPIADLGAEFFSRVPPTSLPAPRLAVWNSALAQSLGLPAALAEHPDSAEVLVGNRLPASVDPIATVYAGHQFGQFAGQLGDGRAILLGELNGQEIQLKGAGETPYSRMGDGRAVLRSTIREYLCSEAMHGLGIPTTRALAITVSPQTVWRETAETAAVLTRVAPSHLRFGHFENFFWRDRVDSLQRLADYSVRRYYPECQGADNPYQAMLEAVIKRTASLIAQWQGVGFCHGVMNSDNMSLLGLTIDYGPYGFLDGYDYGHICNHSDDRGRYAYGRQPEVGLFNLHCLAQALLPLLDRDQAVAALQSYQGLFDTAHEAIFRAKLGLATVEEGDWDKLVALMALMQTGRTDWTIFWRRLCDFDSSEAAMNTPLRDMVVDREGFDVWAADYKARLRREGSVDAIRRVAMQGVNPHYVLRNHLAENAIRLANSGDFSEVQRLQSVLAQPYVEQAGAEQYAAFPPDWASALSVSCSS